MSNPLRNAMVYFGLADEEYDEAVPETRSEPVAARAATPRAAEAPAREHPSNVTPITPAPKPVPTRVTGEMNEILTVHPRPTTRTRRSLPKTSAMASPSS